MEKTLILKLLAALVVAMVAGCAEPLTIDAWREVPAPPRAGDAATTALAVYHVPGWGPEIHWYGGAGLDCPGDPTSWWRPDVGLCIDGDYRFGVAAVADKGGPLHLDAVAHEMLHYAYDVEYGDPDDGHTRDGWAAGGLLDRAVAAMTAEGM